MIKAIIFDVDGTLSETEEVHRKAFNRSFGIHGLSWHWNREEYKRLLDVSGGKERIRHFMCLNPDHKLIVDSNDRFIREIHATKTEIYAQLVTDGAATLRPGVRQLIQLALGHKLRLAIATTTSLPNVEALLQAEFGDRGMALFDVICAGDSVPNKKPAADIYLATLQQLELRPPECIAIEDSRNGLVSATGAGIATIVTPGIYTHDQCFDEAALVTSSLGDHRAQVTTGIDDPPRTVARDAGEKYSGICSRTAELVFA